MQTSTILNGKMNEAATLEDSPGIGVVIDGSAHAAREGERLVDVLNRAGVQLAQVCYHPQLGPIQTCDTCMVEIDGKLVRACATTITSGMSVSTTSLAASMSKRKPPSIAWFAIWRPRAWPFA